MIRVDKATDRPRPPQDGGFHGRGGYNMSESGGYRGGYGMEFPPAGFSANIIGGGYGMAFPYPVSLLTWQAVVARDMAATVVCLSLYLLIDCCCRGTF